MRERWAKLADAQLRISSLPSGMVFLGAPANAAVLGQGVVGVGGVVEGALEEAEKARAVLCEENLELKGLVVDAANAVRKILHKAVSPDPDNLEFVRFILYFFFFTFPSVVLMIDVVRIASSFGHDRPFPAWCS